MPDHTVPEVERVTVEDPNRGALEANVSAKMADIFKDSDDVLADESPAGKTSAGATEPAAAVEKEPTETAAATTEEALEKPAEAAEKGQPEKATAKIDPVTVAIPAAYRRSLKAYQWSDSEIDAAAKANPEGFLKTAEKIHMNRVQETQRWADLGRKERTNPAPEKAVESKKFDAAALRAKYGNEPFIDAMELQHAQLEEARAFMSSSRERQAAQELENLTKQVDGYFSSKELEPYHDHYGKSGQTLTDKQLGERQKVLETADLLISGARSMGRPITLDEALTMAHDSVSSPIAAKVAVKKIETQVKARQQQITLRPGSRAPAPKAADRKDLEGKVKAKLATVFS